MKKNPTPHDATFRQFLTQPEIARDFVDIHLPAELRAICDLTTLKLESGSFVEDDLRQYFSDVLYSLKTTSGEDGYVYVLLEAQSSPDKHMAFRLMRYSVAAMQRHIEAGHKHYCLYHVQHRVANSSHSRSFECRRAACRRQLSLNIALLSNGADDAAQPPWPDRRRLSHPLPCKTSSAKRVANRCVRCRSGHSKA